MGKKLEDFRENEIKNLHLLIGGGGTLESGDIEPPIDIDPDENAINSTPRPPSGPYSNSDNCTD